MNDESSPGQRGSPRAALILSLLGLIFWLLPIAGVTISASGLWLAIQAYRERRSRVASAAMILSGLALLLALSYAAAGVYVGLHTPRSA